MSETLAQQPQVLRWSEQAVIINGKWFAEAGYGSGSGEVLMWEKGRGLEIDNGDTSTLLTVTDKVLLGHNDAAYHVSITIGELLEDQPDSFLSIRELVDKNHQEAQKAITRIEKTARLVRTLNGEGFSSYHDFHDWIWEKAGIAHYEDTNFGAAHLINVMLREAFVDSNSPQAKEGATALLTHLQAQGFFNLEKEIAEMVQENGSIEWSNLPYADAAKQDAVAMATLLRQSPFAASIA